MRRLAAVDVAFLGPKLIIAEFGLGVCGSIALGVLTLARAQSGPGLLLGLYLLSVGVNYVPLLVYAIEFARHGSAQAAIADEADDRRRLFRKYRRQSLILLLPLAAPVAVLLHRWRSGA